jgi:hypothetical protein
MLCSSAVLAETAGTRTSKSRRPQCGSAMVSIRRDIEFGMGLSLADIRTRRWRVLIQQFRTL